MTDKFAAYQSGLDSPAGTGFTITKHDTTNFTYHTRAIYVGGTGDVVVVWDDDTTSTFSAVPVGTTLRVRAKRVNSTGTTASLMIGMY